MSPPLPPLIASKYRPLRELGRGGMGAVYLVEHVNTGERFALKVLLGDQKASAQAVERFKMEARASARIGSENVVRMIDADAAPELDGALFLVMELLDGLDLDKLVAKQGPLSPSQAAAVLSQAARALDKAHAAGIVHRDLKPENIFLHRREDDSSVVKILDFGISKFFEATEQGNRSLGLTKTGSVLGTPLYMATEQINGGKITARTDVWALGLVAFCLLTGKSYWKTAHRPDGSVMALVAEITVDTVEPPSARAAAYGVRPSWGGAFDGWFLRCVEREPERRFAGAGEAIRAMCAALGVAPDGVGLPLPPRAERASAVAPTIHEVAPTVDSTLPGPTSAPAPARALGASTGMAMIQSFQGQPSAALAPTLDGRPRSKAPVIAAGSLGAVALLAAGVWLGGAGGQGERASVGAASGLAAASRALPVESVEKASAPAASSASSSPAASASSAASSASAGAKKPPAAGKAPAGKDGPAPAGKDNPAPAGKVDAYGGR